MPHQHELQCHQHDTDLGECCQHCPAWPNRALRDAVLAALDAADTAGVVLTYMTGSQRQQRTAVSLTSTRDDGRPMSREVGLSIIKAAGVDDVEVSEPYRGSLAQHWRQALEPRGGGGLSVIVHCPEAEVPALVVEAVLSS